MGRLRRWVRWVVRGREQGLRSRLRGRFCSAPDFSETVDAPQVTEPIDDGFREVCGVSDLQMGEVAEFIVDEVPIALARLEAGFHAVDNACPHAGGPLGDGEIEECEVICPLHGWRFDLRTGICDVDPELVVERYPVEVRAEHIYVRVQPSEV